MDSDGDSKRVARIERSRNRREITYLHAVLQIDHHLVRVLQFDAREFSLRKITVHRRDTGWHADDANSEESFFADVCDSLEDVSMVLVAGVEASQAGLRHYLDSQPTTLRARIIGWESIDPGSEAQLLAAARQYFIAHEHGLRPFVRP